MKILWTISTAALLCLFSGCGRDDGPATYQVSGTVTLDGKPVEDGQIVFRAVGGTDKAYAGKVTNGTFSFPSTAGQKQVEISSLQEATAKKGMIGGISGDPVSPENPAVVVTEKIPARYNAQTTLTADVTSGGPNKFDFELTTAGR